MAREPFIRSIILLALSFYLGHVLLSGKITAYIHPRFVGFTWFAVAGFALIGGAMLIGALRMRDRPLRPALYLSVLVPVLLGVAVPPTTFGAELVARQGINLLPRQRSRVAIAAQPALPAPSANPAPPPPIAKEEAGEKQPGDEAAPETPATPPAGQGAPTSAPAADSAPPAPTDAPVPEEPAAQPLVASVVLTEKNMFHLLNEIYEAPERYMGAAAEMTGFVYKLEDLAADEFALVRLVVTCHVAHAVPDGFITVYSGADNLAVDSWYQVRGVLEPGTYQGQATIKLRVTELTPLSQPKDPYIYP